MFRGSIVALVTPFLENGDIAVDSLRELVEFHIKNGTDALVAVGSTGESATLNHDEKTTVIRHTVEQAAGRVPVIAGTGTNATRETIEATRHAMTLGVDACLLVVPYYNRPTQDGLFQHYSAIAQAVPIPQILYNVPGRTASDLLPETVGRLSEISNIVAIKEATGQLERVKLLQEYCQDRLDLFTGDDETALDFILLGGKGDISVTANIAPRLMHDMCQAALTGQVEHARACNAKLMGLHQALFCEPNPIPTKWLLKEMGLIPSAKPRLPLTPLTSAHHQRLRDALALAQS